MDFGTTVADGVFATAEEALDFFRGILDDYMNGMGKPSSKEKDTAQKELFLEKFLKKVEKLHAGHITSMILQVLFPRENIENQARAITSIFQAMDPKMQSLIQVPLDSNTIHQHHLSSVQASLAFACLLRQFYVQGTVAIKDQEAAIKAHYVQARNCGSTELQENCKN